MEPVSPTPTGKMFTITHGNDVSKSYQVPLKFHNPDDRGQKVRITEVKCKGGTETEFHIVEDVRIHRKGNSLKPADYYFDLDPNEEQACTLFLGPYTRKITPPNRGGGMGAMEDHSITVQTCASVSFRITATNLATGETVMLCGENTAPEEQLPQWEVERQQKKGFFEAIHSGDVETVRRELAVGAAVNEKNGDYRESPLMFALRSRQVESARVLLDAKADMNEKAEYGRSLLQFLSFGRDDAAQLAQLLIERNADVNKRGEFACPLHSAAENGRVGLMRFLLENHADANPTDGIGNTPIHYAAVLSVPEAARFLVENREKYGVDISKLGVDYANRWRSETPLDAARRKNRTDIIALLEEAGAKSAKA